LLALAVGGCRKEQISVYRIPKDSPMASALPSGHDATSLHVKYQTPGGWTEVAASGMSQANFSIADGKAQVSIMAFPKEGVSQLNLINIIRQDAGLPALSDDEVAKLIEPVSVGGEKGSLIDLTAATSATGAAPTNSVLVAVMDHGGSSWFFKMAGAPEIVAAQKTVLREFLKSVSFGAGSALPAGHPQVGSANDGGMPAGHPPVGSASGSDGGMPAAASAALPPPPSVDKPAWEMPVGWHEVPPGQMLLAKFSLAANDGAADITVSSFPGEVGGLLANINRWRGQVGLPAVGDPDLEKSYASLDVLGGKAMLVDVNGAKNGKDTRLIGVIWPRNGQTWFYKMMGDSAVAGREKDKFLKFIQSVKYPNG
jgi:hypothetical protein